MNIDGVTSVTAQGQKPQAAGDRAVREAAQQFEKLLLRTMLKQMEKSIHVSGKSGAAGSSLYGSMMVDALADAMVKAGGVGFADKVAQSMQESLPEE